MPRSPRATITQSAALDGLRLLDLRDQRQARVLAHERDVLRAAHERQRDEVDADLLAVGEVAEVLGRHRGQLVQRPRDVEPLARGDRPADLDLGIDLGIAPADLLHAQADGTVGEVHDVARRHRRDELGSRDAHATRRAGAVLAAGERHHVAGLELDEVVLERPDAQLRTRQVLQDRDRPAGATGRLADAPGGVRMPLLVAVREVQPRHVHPGVDHPGERLAVARGGADRGDDLRAAAHRTAR
jgi:hypothetical protein